MPHHFNLWENGTLYGDPEGDKWESDGVACREASLDARAILKDRPISVNHCFVWSMKSTTTKGVGPVGAICRRHRHGVVALAWISNEPVIFGLGQSVAPARDLFETSPVDDANLAPRCLDHMNAFQQMDGFGHP
jgi:hypothetical protein